MYPTVNVPEIFYKCGDPNPDLESLWPTSDGPVSLPVNTSPYWTVLSGLMTNPPMPPYALHPALSRADASTHYHEGSASGLCSSQLPCSRDPANHFDQSAYPLPSSSTPFVEGMGLWPHPEPQTHGLGLVCLAYEPSLSMGGAGSGIPSTADMTSTSSSGTPIRDASSDMEIRPLSVTRPTIGSERQRKVSNGRRLLEARYTCNVDGCDGTFTRRHNLKNHLRSHSNLLYHCRMCEQPFRRASDRGRHERKYCKEQRQHGR